MSKIHVAAPTGYTIIVTDEIKQSTASKSNCRRCRLDNDDGLVMLSTQENHLYAGL